MVDCAGLTCGVRLRMKPNTLLQRTVLQNAIRVHPHAGERRDLLSVMEFVYCAWNLTQQCQRCPPRARVKCNNTLTENSSGNVRITWSRDWRLGERTAIHAANRTRKELRAHNHCSSTILVCRELRNELLTADGISQDLDAFCQTSGPKLVHNTKKDSSPDPHPRLSWQF